jgi:hypothetical protein
MQNQTDSPLDQTLGNFMAMTAKSTVAIVVPLFGYWNDVEDNMMNGEVLSVALRHVQSTLHNVILIFVAHPASLENDMSNPYSVVNVLTKYAQGGNTMSVPVSRDATYGDYIAEGMDVALNSTKASFICVFNPWVITQGGALEVLIDRTNFGDNAKVVSGFNMRPLLDPELFDMFKSTTPIEELDLSTNLMCMSRQIAELINFEEGFHTHKYVERNIWQTIQTARFHCITTQRVPIFEFDFPWDHYETREQLQSDEYKFVTKWGYSPGILDRP